MTGITYGHALLDDCSDVSDYAEVHDDLAATLTSDGSVFTIEGTSNGNDDEYAAYEIVDPTDFRKFSTTDYSEVLVRYKTSVKSGGFKAKVRFGDDDANNQDETLGFSTAWKIASITLTELTGNLNEISLQAVDDNGVNTTVYQVYFHFLLFYRGTFTFPVTTRLQLTLPPRYADIGIPRRVGDITQGLGSELATVHLEGEMELGSGWGSTPGQYMMWINHESHSEAFQWFTSTRANFKVTSRPLIFTEADGKPSFMWDLKEYRDTDAGDETYLERFGIE